MKAFNNYVGRIIDWNLERDQPSILWSDFVATSYGDMTWTILAATIDSLDELRKCLKSAFLLSRTPELLDSS
jgi:hypothetical protein